MVVQTFTDVIIIILFFFLQVKELNLDNCRSDKGAIEGLNESYESLEVLSLINTGLTTLKNFPALPNLRKVCWLTLFVCLLMTLESLDCFHRINVQA